MRYGLHNHGWLLGALIAEELLDVETVRMALCGYIDADPGDKSRRLIARAVGLGVKTALDEIGSNVSNNHEETELHRGASQHVEAA